MVAPHLYSRLCLSNHACVSSRGFNVRPSILLWVLWWVFFHGMASCEWFFFAWMGFSVISLSGTRVFWGFRYPPPPVGRFAMMVWIGSNQTKRPSSHPFYFVLFRNYFNQLVNRVDFWLVCLFIIYIFSIVCIF